MTVAPLTLIELRQAYPDRFYRNQDWFANERFMRALPNERSPRAPTSVGKTGTVPTSNRGLPLAVDLANAYIASPTLPIWKHCLWCRDTDANGQRVYVTDSGRGLEIHRHLHLTDAFGTPQWD